MNLKNIDFNNLDDKTKGLVKIGVILLGILLFFIIFFFIFKLIVGTKLSFDKIENVMVRAAKNYVEEHPEKIDEGVYGTIEIPVSDLIAEGHMKEMAKYTDKKTICTGSVLVFKNLENISYSPKLDCGDSYKYKNLTDVITETTNLVTEEGGLYKVEAEKPYYIYKGENVDNYIQFGNQMWRILRVNEDGNLRLMRVDPTKSLNWDDRYNIDKKFAVGINEFESKEASRIKQSLLELYNDEEIFTKEVKSLIIPTEQCIGKRSPNELDNTGAIECSKKSEMMGVGALYLSEYFIASLDSNCFGHKTPSCKNYNYLAKTGEVFWTLTASSEDTFEVYSIISNPILDNASSSAKILPVVVVNGNINYTKGDGTLENPYIIDIKA